MKKLIALLLAVVMVFALAACGGDPDNGTTKGTEPAGNESKPTENQGSSEAEAITLTVWGPQEDQANADSFLQVATAQFAEQHPEWKITWKFGVCAEGDAGGVVSKDPSAAADVYMFANDQLGALKDANAIAKLGGSTLEQVKADNSETMVISVSDANGDVYGVPFTGNTWFMYYDTSFYTEEDIKSLDAMMAKGTVAFPVTNTWYIPAFFYAVGGTMYGTDGFDGAAGVNFGGEQGVAAATYIMNALKAGTMIDDAGGAGMDGLRNGTVHAIFSGSWDAANVKEILGDNFGAAQLPAATINGQECQLYSFSGSKAFGVNPTSKNLKAANALAAWLGSAEMQKLHYDLRNGEVLPCADTLLASADFAENVVAQAQNNTIANTSKMQPTISEMSAYWGNSDSLGKALVNGDITEANVAEMTQLWADGLNNSGL